MSVLASVKPLVDWWKLVRSWQKPALSASVALCVILWACFPSRGTVVALVLFAGMVRCGISHP